MRSSKKQRIRDEFRDWKVEISPESVQALRQFAGHLNEVCGILVGKKKTLRTFEVTKLVLDESSQTTETQVGVTRKTKSVYDELETIVNSSDDLNWIGEWHTHPDGNCQPSGLDRFSMSGLLNDPEYGKPESVLLVIAGPECLGAWVFNHEIGMEQAALTIRR